jgi:hypothetical protein
VRLYGTTATGTNETLPPRQRMSPFAGIALQNSMVLWMKGRSRSFSLASVPRSRSGVANLHRQPPPDATPTLSKRLRREERGRGA